MITIKQLEKEWGAPVEEWEGNCYGLACAAAKLIKGAVPIYGHYQGEVHPSSMFHGPNENRYLPFLILAICASSLSCSV